MFKYICAELLNFILKPVIQEATPDSVTRILSPADPVMLHSASVSQMNPFFQSIIVLTLALVVYFFLKQGARIAERKVLPRMIDRQPMLNLSALILSAAVYYVITVNIYHLPVQMHLGVLGTILVLTFLAAYQNVANSMSGLLLLITCPFRVGDRITVDGCTGNVIRRCLNHTVLTLESGSAWYVPNRLFYKQSFRNLTAGRGFYPVTFELRIPRDLDLNETRRKAREVVLASPYIYLDEQVDISYKPAQDDHIFLIVHAFVIDQKYADIFITNLTETLIPLLIS